MEEASVNAIKELLPSGQTSVGVGFNIQHLSATPLGLNVRAEAVVTEVNGRKVKLSVTAFDDKEKIGEGTHERVLVDHARFIQKANAKLDSKAN
jgi:predicted thioesterase